MTIIVLSEVRDIFDPDQPVILPEETVMLRLEYGLILSNADRNSTPTYYLFRGDHNRIVKTYDVETLLAELERIPDRSTIDMISKCTVGFYTTYGRNIQNEYDQVVLLLKRKECVLIQSLDDDRRHVFFCSCERGFRILDEVESRRLAYAGALERLR